jgi:site-specific DNA-methyltransferase (adenine-specific)
MVDLRLGDNKEILKSIEDNSVDLVVTSPPYDNLRTYKDTLQWGWEDFTVVAEELYRVLKDGGVVVWVVGDATIDGSETGTSFRQALYFKEIGFRLHDTMLYAKNNPMPNAQEKRYSQSFEYMFVFSKGIPKTFNPIMEKSTYGGTTTFGSPSSWNVTGELVKHHKREIKEFKKVSNIFCYTVGSLSNDGVNHPAVFPEQLALDMISSWSNAGDMVLDPFMGSGTSGKVSVAMGRSFIGIEIVPEYFELAKDRIGNTNVLW